MQGLQETFKKTPVMAQLETKKPGEESFLHTRTCSPPRATIATMQRDPCNFEENIKKPEMDNLWPRLQDKAAQVRALDQGQTVREGNLPIMLGAVLLSTLFHSTIAHVPAASSQSISILFHSISHMVEADNGLSVGVCQRSDSRLFV